jgi:predicted nuclease of predicted toxin-antitoxin system
MAVLRFLLDECMSPQVAEWLCQQGHDAIYVAEAENGFPDDEVLSRAVREDRILITNDKGFGERIHRYGQEHRGLILLRLEDRRIYNIISVLAKLLVNHEALLTNRFLVVTEKTVRIVHR